MSGLRRGPVQVLAVVAFLLGSALLLNCQPAQPVATPKAGEKAAATATKPAATPVKVEEKPVRGGTLQYAAGSDYATLDAHAISSSHLVALLYERLIQRDDNNFRLTKEGLFRDWTISSDGKAITFKLREGVKFHDGTDFDAAAVKSNVERIKDPATKAAWASNYLTVASVEVVDSLTVRFNLNQIDPLFLPRLSTMGGLMVSPAAVKKYGQDFGRNPVGSGPFQIVEWLPGDRATLKRFEGYWGKGQDGSKLPYLDGVVVRVVEDETARTSSLKAGQSDIVTGFPPTQLSSLKADPNLTYTAMPVTQMNVVYLNTKRPPFDNKALRQAVALALDREGITGLKGEGASVQASVFHPDSVNWGADPKAGAFPARDVVKAKAKVAEAGYPSGGLKVKFTSNNALTAIREAEVVKANLAEIGLEVEIEALAQTALFTKIRTEQTYQISLSSTGSAIEDPGHFFGIGLRSKGSRNYYGPYSNPMVDELIDKAGAIYDQKERVALYNEAARMVVDDVPLVPVNVDNSLTAMNRKLRNFVPYPGQGDLGAFRQAWLVP